MLVVILLFCISLNILLCMCLLTSLREGETRAIFCSVVAIAVNSIFWGLLVYYEHTVASKAIGAVAVIAVSLFCALSMIHYFPKAGGLQTANISIEQYDERDHMFSRNSLQYYPGIAKEYYDKHPELSGMDAQIHEKPELGEKGGRFYDSYLTPVAAAAFNVLSKTQHLVRGEKAEDKEDIDIERFTRIIREIAYYYGAVDLGIARLKGYHLYSHAGRNRENYGECIENNHRSAIVIIVAMDAKVLKEAPTVSVILESSKRYVESAKIAHIIAEYIRSFGYDARSHVDGNYEALCVPLANDAGLGEVGRIGLLIHPVYGPCVRISAVTTELELPETKGKNYHIGTFCQICRKCADNCPGGAISKRDKTSTRNFQHWSIRQESCYSFWKDVGTDCGFCIRVCPYTRPNTLFHRLAKFYVSRNPLNQRIALLLDNLLYGKRIKMKTASEQSKTVFKRFAVRSVDGT